MIGQEASKRIEIADKSFRVLKFLSLLFHEVTEIIKKAADIEEFY